MGEDGMLKRHLEEWKYFLKGRMSLLEDQYRFSGKRLPRWSASDVEEFIASDPVHGPIIKTTLEAGKFGLNGGIIGAVSTAVVAWKYSKSPHGAVLAFGAGGVFGGVFGAEAANHWFQLYRLDTRASQAKFFEWWQSKTQGRS